MAGYEVKGPNGERGWWDGKKITPLDANGLPAKAQRQPNDQARDDAFRRESDSMKAIENARSRAGFWTTGPVGAISKNIPGTWAYDLDKDVDTLRARVGFNELAAMRAASPTGGALGNVTEKELAMLQAAGSNLEVGQSGDQFRSNLDRLEGTVKARQPGLTPETAVDLSGGQSRTTIPKGAYYRDPQGNIRRNDNLDAGNPIMRPANGRKAATSGLPPPPKRGEVRDGYRYNGGPPDNPKSWTKQ
jgi:hypothetical protein